MSILLILWHLYETKSLQNNAYIKQVAIHEHKDLAKPQMPITGTSLKNFTISLNNIGRTYHPDT